MKMSYICAFGQLIKTNYGTMSMDCQGRKLVFLIRLTCYTYTHPMKLSNPNVGGESKRDGYNNGSLQSLSQLMWPQKVITPTIVTMGRCALNAISPLILLDVMDPYSLTFLESH